MADATGQFDPDLVAAVAADHDFPVDRLHALLGDLQAFVEAYESVGGVDGLVYEWRTTFPEDPLRERTPKRYYLAVGEETWADFRELLDLSAVELDAVRAVHERAFAATRDATPGQAPMVLLREATDADGES